MDHVYSSTVYTFARLGDLDNAFTEVGLSSDYGTLSPFENKRIGDKYGGCAIPFL